jgi:hypothetical protein
VFYCFPYVFTTRVDGRGREGSDTQDSSCACVKGEGGGLACMLCRVIGLSRIIGIGMLTG